MAWILAEIELEIKIASLATSLIEDEYVKDAE